MIVYNKSCLVPHHIHSITHKFVAMKEIQLEHKEGAPCTAIREISLLKDLKHANIVTLHDIIHTDKSLTLVFEYVEQNLTEYMDECRGMMSMTNVKVRVTECYDLIAQNDALDFFLLYHSCFSFSCYGD